MYPHFFYLYHHKSREKSRERICLSLYSEKSVGYPAAFFFATTRRIEIMKPLFGFLILILSLPVSIDVFAQEASTPHPADILDLAPAAGTTLPSAEDLLATHPMLRMTPDKTEIVTLDSDAASVIVGNPAHINVQLDTPRTMVVTPLAPGATYLTVLDQERNVIMQRHIIVASPKQRYIRIRRSCANAEDSSACKQTSVYFCPDMCHEIDVTQMGEDID